MAFQPADQVSPKPWLANPMRLAAAGSAHAGAPGERGRSLLPFLLCALAAVAASWLSGIAFPGQNNVWHVPIVLDFAGSAEGPHDPYHQSFRNFTSIFWSIIKLIASEDNIQTVFTLLNVLGNAYLALSIFYLARAASARDLPVSIAVSFLCFAYGLWISTRLGYSELFVSQLTHTQFAVSSCVIALALMVAHRPLTAALVLGLAANLNLFIAFWAAILFGLALLADQRGRAALPVLLAPLLFLIGASPVLAWVLATARSTGLAQADVPIAFFSQMFAGHMFGLSYPQALSQTLALLLAAGLALRGCPGLARLQRLGSLGVIGGLMLPFVVALPYVTSNPLLLNLHPLRSASVLTAVSAAAAAALFATRFDDSDPEVRLGAILAVAGFSLRLPVVSVLGFAMAMPATSPGWRLVRLLLPTIAAGALLLPAPELAANAKDVAGMVLIGGTASLAGFGAAAADRPDAALRQFCLAALALVSGLATVASREAPAWTMIALLAALFLVMVGTATRALLGAAMLLLAAAAGGILLAMADDRLFLAGGVTATASLAIIPLGRAWPAWGREVTGLRVIAALLLVLVPAGLLRGAASGFAVSRDGRETDFLAAQRWARANTAPGTMFMAPDAAGFSLFSRRPVWLDQAQHAAVLWQPGFYPMWRCRADAMAQANTLGGLQGLMQQAGVAFAVIRADRYAQGAEGSFPAVYQNRHWVIIEAPAAAQLHPSHGLLCPG